MRRVDYINQEPVKCFPTPIIDIEKLINSEVVFSTGEYVDFKSGAIVPVSTYFYRYSEDLLILDIEREEPIVHIIRDERVIKTIYIEKLTDIDIKGIKQVINTQGETLKIKTREDINNFISGFEMYKKDLNNTYKQTRLKLEELIESSDRMRKLDKIAATSKVLDFINIENFQQVKSKTLHLYKSTEATVEEYKNNLLKINNFNIFVVISNYLDTIFYNDFKMKNEEHIQLLSEARDKSSILLKEFQAKWLSEDKYKLEKHLGSMLDCYNEVLCSKTFSDDDLKSIGDNIVRYLNEHEDVEDSYLEWVTSCPHDRMDMKKFIDSLKTDISTNKATNTAY